MTSCRFTTSDLLGEQQALHPKTIIAGDDVDGHYDIRDGRAPGLAAGSKHHSVGILRHIDVVGRKDRIFRGDFIFCNQHGLAVVSSEGNEGEVVLNIILSNPFDWDWGFHWNEASLEALMPLNLALLAGSVGKTHSAPSW